MKFFIPISNFRSAYLAYIHYDVPNTAVLPNPLCYPCSIPRTQLPKSDETSISSATPKIPPVTYGKCAPLTSLHSTKVDIIHAYGRDLYSLLPSISQHSPHYISELSMLDNVAGHPRVKNDSDIWSPRLI